MVVGSCRRFLQSVRRPVVATRSLSTVSGRSVVGTRSLSAVCGRPVVGTRSLSVVCAVLEDDSDFMSCTMVSSGFSSEDSSGSLIRGTKSELVLWMKWS